MAQTLAKNPHIGIRPEWLALRTEEILEPELKIVDPHHHLWERQDNLYLFHDLLADMNAGHHVVSTVFVQCRSMLRKDGPAALAPLGEVEFVTGIAAMSASGLYGSARACAGIVAGADLQLGDQVAPVLELMAHSAGGRLRGVRNPVVWHSSPDVESTTAVLPAKGLMADTAFRKGVAQLGMHGLSLDVWAYHTQLGELYELAKANPKVTVIVDHFGGPVGVGPHAADMTDMFKQWRAGIALVASLPNTVIKMGGAGMPVFGIRFDQGPTPPASEQLAVAWRAYFETCIECFGVDRCMFESNFPVDKGMFSYQVLWNGFKRLAKDYSASEKSALFSATAERVYRLV
ncbi:MAG: amidohydrolase family protein [Alcaligenaceae bacterium]